MVWFTFTFLLGIPINTRENFFEQLKENDEMLNNGKNYIERDVSKPHFSCHIEYILLPNQPSKFIDVVCWDHAAKIYLENSTSAIMPFIIEKLGWIHFRVNHKIKLATEDIPSFHKHKVKFSVKLGAKTLGEAAKVDKPKKFYGSRFSDNSKDYIIKKQLFHPLSETLEELHYVSFLKEQLRVKQRLHVSLDTTIETSEHFKKLYKVLLDLSDEYHNDNCIRIQTISRQEIPPLINVLGPELEKINIDANKERRKTINLKKKEAMNKQIEFFIAGEEFLCGRKAFENCLKYKSEELPYIFCLSEAKNLLNKVQTKIFNPLSITLSHINNLPVDELLRCGVSKIKFQYLIFNEFLSESNLIPINNHIKLNYARTILTNSIDKNQLIQFIQTGGLRINILGNTEHAQVNKRKIYSRDLINNRPYILQKSENPENKKSNELILLGTAFVDISSILFQPHKVLVKSNFKMLSSDLILGKSSIFTYFTAVNELSSSNKKIKCPNISQCIYLTSPVLTVSAKISNPITIIYKKVLMNPNLFNRLFLILYDINIAFEILQIIQEDLTPVLKPMDQIKNGLNIKRPLFKRNLGNSHPSIYSNKQQITGFLIDCIDKILIYVESSMFGNIQKIWAVASSINPTKGRVLYDSSLVFLDRLYENFFKIGGVLTIILREMLEVSLSRPRDNGSGNVPVPALNVLTRLQLLSGCDSIKAAIQNNLFPDPDSLWSLATEFGKFAKIYEKPAP